MKLSSDEKTLFPSFSRLLQLASCHCHDAAIASAANGDDAAPSTSVDVSRKRLTFVRCCVKLLASCGSKQKNFLAAHKEQLVGALDALLLDIELVNLKGKRWLVLGWGPVL